MLTLCVSIFDVKLPTLFAFRLTVIQQTGSRLGMYNYITHFGNRFVTSFKGNIYLENFPWDWLHFISQWLLTQMTQFQLPL